mgnify:CR=1 FL=1
MLTGSPAGVAFPAAACHNASAWCDMAIRVFIVEDHRLLSEGLRPVLEEGGAISVVGDATTGREALAAIPAHKPDVILMDLSLPDISGVEVTREILKRLPDTKVLCLSMHTDARYVLAMLRAGARGYVPKDAAADELVRAVCTVGANQVYLSPRIAGHVLHDWRSAVRGKRTAADGIMTAREREVLRLIAEGHSSKEIAARLTLSVKTVASHRRRLMSKLRLRSIAEATKYAVREGLVTLS